MTAPASPLVRWRVAAISASALLALLSGVLVTQHLRHGWPFSLHHGYTRPGDPHAAHRADGGVASGPRRVAVSLDTAQTTSIGITLATVRRAELGRPFRVTATIAPDETRVSHVHTRVSGWIQRLYVNVTGQRVRAGQTLATIFSQELLASQNELLGLLRAQRSATTPALASAQQSLLEGARNRLRVFGMTGGEIAAIERSGVARREVAVAAPRDGVVLHRGITVGAAVDPSTELLTVADLSRVWVLLEVPESEIPSVALGAPVTVSVPAAGDVSLESSIEFLAPALTEQTRTLRARASLPNPEGRLRPGSFGTAMVRTQERRGLVVPRDALVDTGTAQHVFVATGEASFAPRTVVIGSRIGDQIEVREGLTEGERVVASGVFLLDSESRLRASGGTGTGHAGHGGGGSAAPGASQQAPESQGRHGAGPGHAGHGGE